MTEMFKIDPAKSDDRNAKKVSIVITDGKSKNPEATALAAKEAREEGIEMIAVGLTGSVDDKELADIASRPEWVFNINTFDKLVPLLKLLVEKACKSEYIDACNKDGQPSLIKPIR